MKSVASLAQLEEYGIVPLTGESDRLRYRSLCDLTKDGVELMGRALGVNWNLDDFDFDAYRKSTLITIFGLARNWNSGIPDAPHVASVLLAYDAWTWIAPEAMIPHYRTVFATRHENGVIAGIWGLEENEKPTWTNDSWHIERDGVTMSWPTVYGDISQVYTTKVAGQPYVGTRNVHAMSGRTI